MASLMHEDEMTIVKSTTISLDKNIVLILTKQYHSQKNPNDSSKVDHSKSEYRWLGRITTIEDIKKKIQWCWSDEHRLERAQWPNDPKWFQFFKNTSDNYHFGKWLAERISKNKINSWETGQKILKGWKKATPSRPVEEFNRKWGYAIKGYTTDSGETIDLLDKENLLKHVGQNVSAPDNAFNIE